MRITLVILALFWVVACSNALGQSAADEWQYSLTPYLWLPTIDGTLRYSVPPGGGGSPNVGVGPTDWLDLLNFALLISGSAKKGQYTIFSDFAYLSMSSTDGRVASVDDTISVPGVPVPIPISASLNVGTKTELDALVWMVAGGYSIMDTGTETMDVFAGVRYFGVDFSTRWDLTADITTPGGSVVLPAQGSVARDTDLWDGIVGARGEFEFTAEKWSVPFYIDVGTGSSDMTWQGMLGLTYAFGWGELMMLYRHLEYDQSSGGLLQDFSFSGPAIGARFSF